MQKDKYNNTLKRFKIAGCNVIVTTYHDKLEESQFNWLAQGFQELCKIVWCQLSEIPIATNDDGTMLCKYTARFVVDNSRGGINSYADYYKVFTGLEELRNWCYDIQSLLKVFTKGGDCSRIGDNGIKYDIEVEHHFDNGSKWVPIGASKKKGNTK